MEILILLLLLEVKHWYADFFIQTYQQTVRKGIYRDLCGISHSLDHVWASIVALMIFNIFVQPLTVLSMIVVPFIEGFLHYHIDWIKVKFGSKDLTKPLFWSQFGLDQLLHKTTYFIMVWYLLLFK